MLDVALAQDGARDLDPGLRAEHVPRTGREKVGDIEAGRAPEGARHALVEQQHLDELGFCLLARSRDSAKLSARVLRFDLPRPLPAAGRRLLDVYLAGVGEG